MVGAVSYTRLSLRQFPEVDKPIISVTTSLEGASPQIIEAQITRPLEEALGGVEGLDYIASRSETENSVIKLYFKVDRNIDLAAADVRDRLQKVRNKLPDEADDPLIKKTDADALPMIYLSIRLQPLTWPQRLSDKTSKSPRGVSPVKKENFSLLP